MRPEDAIGHSVDHDLRPRRGLGVNLGRKPAEHIVDMHVDRKRLLARCRLRQADGGERGNRVDRARHALVVGTVPRSLDNITSDDIAFIGCDWRKLWRNWQRVATDIDKRIRRRAQIAVNNDATIGLRDVARAKVERVDIGKPAGAVDDAIGLCRLLNTVASVDHSQFPVGSLDALYPDIRR